MRIKLGIALLNLDTCQHSFIEHCRATASIRSSRYSNYLYCKPELLTGQTLQGFRTIYRERRALKTVAY